MKTSTLPKPAKTVRSYWNHTGRFQAANNALEKLIPDSVRRDTQAQMIALHPVSAFPYTDCHLSGCE
jgi:hypothetical protein